MHLFLLLLTALSGCGPGPDPSDSAVATDTGATDTDPTDPTEPPPVDCDAASEVRFTGDDGAWEDLTAAFTAGTPVTLDRAGTLAICPGSWSVAVTVVAPVEVEVFREDPGETALVATPGAPLFDVGSGGSLTAAHLDLSGADTPDVGGALRCVDGTLTLDAVVLHDNHAASGGAIHANGCALSVTGSTFSANTADGRGGALAVEGGNAVLEQVRLEWNTAEEGGAAWVSEASATFVETIVQGNAATLRGGAVGSDGADLRFTLSSLIANTATDGGGLHLSGYAYFDRTNVSADVASRGGGLFLTPDAALQVTGCNVLKNIPDDVFVDDGDAGTSYTGGTGVTFTCEYGACFGV